MKRSTFQADGIDGGRNAHRSMRRLNCLAALKTAVLGIALTACAQRASAQTTVEQLTCGDSTMPRATYRRAKLPVRADSLSDVLVVVEDSTHRRIVPADVQTWGMGSGTGRPGDSTGVTAIRDRDPGLYSVRVRLEAQGQQWIYATTLRPRYADTVLVSVDQRCTLIYRGPR